MMMVVVSTEDMGYMIMMVVPIMVLTSGTE